MKNRLLFVLLFFVICGLLVAVFYPVLAFGYGDNSWHTKASMNQARAGLGVAVVDGKIYAIGGYTADNDVPIKSVGTNERYDPETDTWVTLKPMPTPRMYFAIAVYEDKIYCIGGYDRDSVNTSSISDFVVNEVYDTVLDSWSVKSDAPFFGIAEANVVDGKIFITKGNKLFMYDPVDDSWTNKTSIPTSWGNGRVSAVVDDKILFSYGYFPDDRPVEGQPIELVMIYDTKTDTYSEGSVLPKGYSLGATAVTMGVYAPQRIYMIGVKSVLNHNTVYDPINDTWSTAKALPTYRGSFGVAVVDDVIYVIGGRRELGIFGLFVPFKALSTNQQYIPVSYSGSVIATEPLLNYYIIAGLTITIGIVTGIYFLFQKKKRKKLIKTKLIKPTSIVHHYAIAVFA